ncbi:MAG TPA: DUF559 domain-containing protein [Bacillales bacterium]|nr:DUF559 domain-containing protein [Bacillales bacterium]
MSGRKAVLAMLDYFIFFALLATAPAFYVIHLLRDEPTPANVDQQRFKCESPVESRLYNALRHNGHVPVTQYRVGPYRIDIAFPAVKLAIECDGKAYHSTPEQKRHDRHRDAYLRRRGWRVYRFSGSKINGNMASVLRRIERALN